MMQNEKRILDKKAAKECLAYAGYELRHSSAKKFEVTIIIKELYQ
jgi:hypothetical protein